MSITKTAFILVAIAFLMPTPPESEMPRKPANEHEMPQGHLVNAASDTFSDVSQFCGRQPGVCEAAEHLLHKFEAKAKYGVRLLYEWANDQTADTRLPYPSDQAEADSLTTGSTDAALADVAAEPSGTLTIEDLLPEWRGPQAVRRG